MTKRTHLIILLSQFFMLLALEMTNPFLPLLIAELPGMTLNSALFYTTWALALPMAATIIMSPIWGVLADRWGYKPMLMRASWALVLSQALMIFAHSITWILVVRVIQGGFAGFITAMQVYALSYCSWQHKGRQMTRLQSAKALATSLAGVIGGLFLTWMNYLSLYAVATLICLITTLIMQWQLPAVTHPIARMPSPGSNTGMGWFIITFSSLILFTQVARFLSDPVFSLAISHLLNASPVIIGLLYSLPAAGIILSTEWIGRYFDHCRHHPGKTKMYLLTFTLFGALLMVVQANTNYLLLLITTRLLWGIVLAALLPALFTLFSDHYSEQGYALGIANAFAKAGNLLGLFLGGYFGALISLSQLFLIIALVYLLMAGSIWTYFTLPQVAYWKPSHE